MLRTTLDGLLLDWHRDFAAGDDAVMIARRDRDVADLNDRARELRVAEGGSGPGRLRRRAAEFAAGDRVSHPRQRGRGLTTASAGTCSPSTAEARTVELRADRRATGATVVLGPATSIAAPPVGGAGPPARLRPDHLRAPSRRPSTRPSPCSTPASPGRTSWSPSHARGGRPPTVSPPASCPTPSLARRPARFQMSCTTCG